MMILNKENSQFHIEIPSYVQAVLDTLNAAGHEAYIVGGCVRDALMDRTPKDWDVCTSALPEETKAAFAGEKTIDTGLQHGTVTVMYEAQPVEITTYRIDGEYKDGRHPEAVAFTRSLKEDLARRDFTINAMAYHPQTGLVDPFGGRTAIADKTLRCVGESEKRFDEDALRIMRGLRFAAELGFDIEEETLNAMRSCKDGVGKVSKERINVELSKLLMGEFADTVLEKNGELLEDIVEGLQAVPVSQLPQNLAIRLAEVFPKDTGKYLRLLKYDGSTIRYARVLSRLRDTPAPTEPKKEMVRFLHKHGEVITAMHYARAGREELVALGHLLEQKPCYRYSDLAIGGNDLIEVGMNPGPALGETLKKILELVIEEEIENERETLLKAAASMTEQASKEAEHE